jgi:hypothetical protein
LGVAEDVDMLKRAQMGKEDRNSWPVCPVALLVDFLEA